MEKAFRTFYIPFAEVYYSEVLLDEGPFSKAYYLVNPHHLPITAIPDASLDIQFAWKKSGVQGYVCGSFLESGKSETGSYDRCFGVKIRPNTFFKFSRGIAKKCAGGGVDRHYLSTFVRMICSI